MASFLRLCTVFVLALGCQPPPPPQTPFPPVEELPLDAGSPGDVTWGVPDGGAALTVVGGSSASSRLRQGFLHGLSTNRITADTVRRVEELKPGAWRMSSYYGAYDFVTQNTLPARFGTQVVFNLNDVFSGTYGYPVVVGPNCIPNNPRHCFASYDELRQSWSDFMESFMLAVDAQNPAFDYYDLFAEPDWSWKGISAEQFFEIFKIAHDTIRRHRPEAKIVAPSLEKFNGPGLELFFQYAVDNDLRIDAVSWHEIYQTPAEVAGHVEAARNLIQTIFQAKPSLAVKELHINEYGPPQSHLVPGWTVGWLAAFEATGVDHANRGCWKETGGWSDCANGLNGLLLEDDSTPQPLFFVHRAYANLPPDRLEIQSHLPRLEALAGVDAAAGELRLLVGRYSCGRTGRWCMGADLPVGGEETEPVDVIIEVTQYPLGGALADIAVDRIPNLGTTGALLAPTTLPRQQVNVTGSTLRFQIDQLRDGEVCSVIVRRN
ncbi:MAG: hypothetical protein ACOZIN_03960 [Myxococcota bacterium]